MLAQEALLWGSVGPVSVCDGAMDITRSSLKPAGAKVTC